MKRLVCLSLLMVLIVVGCRSSELETVHVRPMPPELPPAEPAASDAILRTLGPTSLASDTKFFAQAEAVPCPGLNVSSFSGAEVKLEPGARGFAESGNVTLIVFWSMDDPAAKAAARHVSDLTRKYAQWRVRGVGIIEKTAAAAAGHSFAMHQGITFPLYYDDLSAVQKMSKLVGAESRAAIPAMFIVDRQLRVRFYRPGFQFVSTIAGPDARLPGAETVEESAPQGETIEDNLRRILSEP
ncbi:MAG: redoxin domain-containing protein [Planctomycetota bacterium]|jgi:peroxiredoxin